MDVRCIVHLAIFILLSERKVTLFSWTFHQPPNCTTHPLLISCTYPHDSSPVKQERAPTRLSQWPWYCVPTDSNTSAQGASCYTGCWNRCWKGLCEIACLPTKTLGKSLPCNGRRQRNINLLFSIKHLLCCSWKDTSSMTHFLPVLLDERSVFMTELKVL